MKNTRADLHIYTRVSIITESFLSCRETARISLYERTFPDEEVADEFRFVKRLDRRAKSLNLRTIPNVGGLFAVSSI